MSKRVAFITELDFESKIPVNNDNMRTEFAWMYALDADHYNIHSYEKVKGYDLVVILLPQGKVMVDCHGIELKRDMIDKLSHILFTDFVSYLKKHNSLVANMQEGPTWLFNEYDIESQFRYYQVLSECDILFTHNEYDKRWYKGLFPDKSVCVMPTLLIEHLISNIPTITTDKTIIGGNFARWYGGFQSFAVAHEFENEIWVHSSHATRTNEKMITGLNHLPRLSWYNWMRFLSTTKYAVHLMPTVAAGTFSLNCAYFGIPCIGNKDVDTQRLCHPLLSVDVNDIESARHLAKKLKTNEDFYMECSRYAKESYRKNYDIVVWKEKVQEAVYGR